MVYMHERVKQNFKVTEKQIQPECLTVTQPYGSSFDSIINWPKFDSREGSKSTKLPEILSFPEGFLKKFPWLSLIPTSCFFFMHYKFPFLVLFCETPILFL